MSEDKQPAEDRGEWWKRLEYRHLEGGPYQVEMYPLTGGAAVYELESVGEPVKPSARKTSARNKGGAPRLRDRDPSKAEIEEVIEYCTLIDKGVKPTPAAQQVGRDYRTLDARKMAWSEQIEAYKKGKRRK